MQNRPTSEQFAVLFQAYVENRSSHRDTEAFLELTEDPAYQQLLDDLIEARLAAEAKHEAVSRPQQELLSAGLDAILAARKRPVIRKIAVAYRWAAAAILILVAGTTWLMLQRAKTGSVPSSDGIAAVTAPAKNKAAITLSNGTIIYLDTVANGRTIEVDGMRLTKLSDGKIVYAGEANTVAYNTASNPRGSKVIDLELADHSHVWLNAGSSITYPVVFNTNTRKVSITGEAYFEVAHDANKPFIVNKGETNVQVLGTHFNVKAYDNDPVLKVTLLEGKVRVHAVGKDQMLAPNEQAIVTDENIVLTKDVDVNAVTAWLRGKTVLASVGLDEVLREIERWYDIQTEIKSDRPKDDTYFARISREAPLSEMLKTLEQNNVKYEYNATTRKLTIQ